MAMTTSELSIVVKSQGIKDATTDLINLAKAASSVDAETKAFVIAQQKLAVSTKAVVDEEKKRKLQEQKLDMMNYNAATKQYVESFREAVSINKQLAMAENARKLVQQKRDTEAYLEAVNARISAEKKLSDELSRQKAIQEKRDYEMHIQRTKDAVAAEKERIKALDSSSNALKINARGVTDQQLAMVKAHEQALKMNDAFDKKKKLLEEVNTRGNVYVNTLRSMATAALAYVGVNFVSSIVKQADAWSMMEAKLKIATGSQESAVKAQSELFDLSQKIRIPLEDSLKLYTRLSHPLMMMGKSSKDTKDMVESLGTALKLSGATGQEAASAMLQFSQSMNAGRLNGGEFNSIAEASPNILRAIEVELRRTGQWGANTTETLKKMGSEGKITGELLQRSLANALPQMRKDFESLPITFDSALTRLKNAWEKAVGEMAKEEGFTKEMVKSLRNLEDMVPKIARTLGIAFNFVAQNLGTISIVAGGLVAGGLISYLTNLFEGISLVVKSNVLIKVADGIGGIAKAAIALASTPLGVVLTGLAAVIMAGKWAYDKYNESQEEAIKLAERQKEGIPALVKSMEQETAELEQQYMLIAKKNGLIKESPIPKTVRDFSDLSKLEQANDALIRKSQEVAATLKREGSESENYKNGLIGLAKVTSEYNKIQEEAAKQNGLRVGTQMMVENAEVQKNLALDLKKWSLDKTNQMKEEIKAIDEKYYREENGVKKLIILQSEYNTIIAGIKDKYKGDDVYKSLRDSTVAYSNTLQELKQRYEELQKYGVDDKRTQSEKEYTKLQLEYKQAVDGVVKAEKAKQLVIAKNKVIQEDLINAEIKKQKNFQENLDALTKEADATGKSAEQQEMLLEAYGKTEGELFRLKMVKEENKLTDMAQRGLNDELLTQQQKIVDNLKRESEARDELGARKNLKDLADKYESDYQAANKKIADGLYNAIGKSGESAVKKLIQDIKSWFARLVLSPIINPISNFGASIISPNAASAQGGIGNIAQLGSTLYNSITTGFAAASAASAEAFTSFATSAFGEAIGLSSSAAAMAAETAALTGSTIGAGATTGLTAAGSMGASVASMAPYVAAAVAAFQGVKAINGGFRIGGLSADAGALLGVLPRLIGMEDKKFAPQTVTGNLGTNNLTRNQAWTQEGGLLRSDRADTWKYLLSNSTATTSDGKSYVDNPNLEADKALLNQLNSMYTAIKVTTSEYAKALGMNADSIKSRTDAINFTFGKTAEETSANVAKAFEEITNSIAKDLLGNLKELALQNESSAATMGRLATNITVTNGMFKALGYTLFDLNTAGIKASDAIVTLFGGLDKFQATAGSYYENFYKEEEKTKVKVDAVAKAMKDLGKEMPTSREAFRAMVETAQKAGNNELFVGLMKVSSAFAEVVQWAEKAAEATTAVVEKMDYTNTDQMFPDWTTLRDNLKETINDLSQTAQKWLSVSKQASDIRAQINTVLWGSEATREAAVKKSEKLWKMMASDITVEQKLSIAGELKDSIISKYQIERDSITKMIDFTKQLRTYVDGLKLGSLSPLTMTQKLAEARKQYEATLTKAQAGDTIAQGALTGSANTYLELARTAYASSDAYQAIFNSITNSLDAMNIDSRSAEEKLVAINEAQKQELIKLVIQMNTIESVAESYYTTTVNTMSSQLTVLNNLYTKMGVFDGIAVDVAGLPAELAAALSGTFGRASGADYVTALYSKFANKTGNQIDAEGMAYWTREFEIYGREYVLKSFQDSVEKVNAKAASMAPPPAATTTASNEYKLQVEDLKNEIAMMRQDAQAQTVALMNTLIETSRTNAETIVEGTQEGLDKNNPNWNKVTME